MKNELIIELVDRRLSIKGLERLDTSFINKLYYIVSRESLTPINIAVYKKAIRFSGVYIGDDNKKRSLTDRLRDNINKYFLEKELEDISKKFTAMRLDIVKPNSLGFDKGGYDDLNT